MQEAKPGDADRRRWEEFVAARLGASPNDLALAVRPLRGGLESSAVVEVAARGRDAANRPFALAFVVKRLAGRAAREADVYERVVAPVAGAFAPRLLGVERPASGRGRWLYLERVRPVVRWPWGRTGLARRLLERLAELHASAAGRVKLPPWDYEGDLQASAASLLQSAEAGCGRAELAALRRTLPPLRRLVAALATVRAQLLAFQPLGATVLHGDIHPGNALVARRSCRDEPLLLDWGRARLGSPLEDAASWLQSLGCWEAEARRRHDSLLVAYLAARGVSPVLGPTLREAYWLASACNTLAGATEHHLRVVLGGPPAGRARRESWRALLDCLRVLRRADACWSGA